MDLLFKGIKEDASECPFEEKDMQRCPFLKNINKPTCFSFSSVHLPIPAIPVSDLYFLSSLPVSAVQVVVTFFFIYVYFDVS